MNPREIIEAVIVEDDEAKKPLGRQILRAGAGVIASLAAGVLAKGLVDRALDYKDGRSNEDEDNLTDLQYNE
jgi:hypothetical protein